MGIGFWCVNKMDFWSEFEVGDKFWWKSEIESEEK
jgi:hypothetical protein